MPSAYLLDHVGPFMLVLFRLSGLLVFSPILASTALPLRLRALLCACFALAIYPTLPAGSHRPIEADLFSLMPMVFSETLIGAAMGLMASLPMYAVQLGGLVMGQQAGLALGQVFNPALDTESDTLGQFLQYAALVLFVLLGGLEHLFLGLAHTFTNIPPGGAAMTLAPVELMTGLVASGFELALRVSAPVLCIILIETIASGVLARTIPQINVQSMGFAIKIMITLLVLAAASGAILHATGEDITRTLSKIVQWAENLGASGKWEGGSGN